MNDAEKLEKIKAIVEEADKIITEASGDQFSATYAAKEAYKKISKIIHEV